MANLDTLPTASIPAEQTASTPTPSRAASRARRRATETTVQTETPVTDTTTTSDDLGLPPRGDSAGQVEGSAPQGDNQNQDGAIEGLPERAASDNTVQTAEQPAAPAEPTKLLVLAAKNPKRAGSIAHKYFEMYYGTGENRNMTTVEDAYDRGVRGKDRSWDADRGHILIGDDVDAYLALENDKDRADWLVAKFKNMPKDRLLKMVGIAIEEPKVAEQAVEAADAKGEVKPETEAGATEEVKAELKEEITEDKKETVTA